MFLPAPAQVVYLRSLFVLRLVERLQLVMVAQTGAEQPGIIPGLLWQERAARAARDQCLLAHGGGTQANNIDINTGAGRFTTRESAVLELNKCLRVIAVCVVSVLLM